MGFGGDILYFDYHKDHPPKKKKKTKKCSPYIIEPLIDPSKVTLLKDPLFTIVTIDLYSDPYSGNLN